MGLCHAGRQAEGLVAEGEQLVDGNVEIAVDPQKGIAIGNPRIGSRISRVASTALVNSSRADLSTATLPQLWKNFARPFR